MRGGKGQKDAMDVFGVHAEELGYECNNNHFASRCFFSVNGENNMDTSYAVDCDHLNNSFGCLAVRKKEYCILNRQYDEKTYKELKQKIITQMNDAPYVDQKGKIYKYGEFFPAELCPHSYNETLAQEYFPLNENEAKELGYRWDSFEEKSYTPTKSWKELPETMAATDDSILSEIILCKAWDENKQEAQNHKCTKAFRIIPNELMMYRKWNIPIPRECPNTRNFKMSQIRNSVNFWHRSCMCELKNHPNHKEKCVSEFETSYSPDRPEVVYCETCYQQEVS